MDVIIFLKQVPASPDGWAKGEAGQSPALSRNCGLLMAASQADRPLERPISSRKDKGMCLFPVSMTGFRL